MECTAFVVVALMFHYITGVYISTAPKLRLVELSQTLFSTLFTAMALFFLLLDYEDIYKYILSYRTFFKLWIMYFTATYTIRAIRTWKICGPVSLEDINFKEKYNAPGMVPMEAWQQAVKRIFDIAASLFAMILLSPVVVYIIIRIKSDSKGHILYKQERVGMHGKKFMIYKFRSMYEGAEHDKPMLTTERDSRITPFGNIMRQYRLDELPQFWNVLKGDMSIVGPRPEREYFIKQIEAVDPRYSELYRIRPGLLSWGPIKVGYCDNIEKMVKRLDYDLEYLSFMSIHTDTKIMILSIGVIVMGKGQ